MSFKLRNPKYPKGRTIKRFRRCGFVSLHESFFLHWLIGCAGICFWSKVFCKFFLMPWVDGWWVDAEFFFVCWLLLLIFFKVSLACFFFLYLLHVIVRPNFKLSLLINRSQWCSPWSRLPRFIEQVVQITCSWFYFWSHSSCAFLLLVGVSQGKH